MNKKSIHCLENGTSSSRTELSNSAIEDIIATNHVVLGKDSHRTRLSRACKAAIFMIIFGFIVIGIIAVTLVLANSRNRYLALISRTAPEHPIFDRFNATRRLNGYDENLTREFDENEEKSEGNSEQWTTSTVAIPMTSDRFKDETSTMDNLHLSSLIIRTIEVNEQYLSSQTLSMKPYPSLNTITNEPLTSSTTSPIQTTTATTTVTTVKASTEHTKTVITIDNELRTTEANRITTEGEIVTTMNNDQSDESLTSTRDIATTSSASMQDEQTSPFSTSSSNHFDFESSTMTTDTTVDQRSSMTTVKYRRKADSIERAVDDFLTNLLFS